MGDIEADELRATQRAGEADQKEGAVPQAWQIIAANLYQPPHFHGGQRRGSPGRLTIGARDPARRLADGGCPEDAWRSGMPGR